MVFLPKRKKNKSTKPKPQWRNAGHRQWVRGFECLVNNDECVTNIEAAHVRENTDGGMQVKPSDFWTVPLCQHHHAEQHKGFRLFQRVYKINMREYAIELARRSPKRRDIIEHQEEWA